MKYRIAKVRDHLQHRLKSGFHHVEREFLRRCFINTNYDYWHSIILAGTLRSGTTWIADLINYKNQYRYILDPFHPLAVDIVKHFRWRQYLTPGDPNPIFLEPAKLIMSGKIRYKWTERDNKTIICRKRIIKTNFANLLLPWLKSHFPKAPMVLVLRHPCAVANSLLQVTSRPRYEKFLSQKALVTDFLKPFQKEIENAQSRFEHFIFQWCIETYVPLKYFQPGEIYVVLYENFCTDPLLAVKKLFTFLGIDVDRRINYVLKKPSSACRKNSPIKTGTNLVDSWRETVTGEQINRTFEILSLFGLDKIYSAGSLPKIDNEKVLEIF